MMKRAASVIATVALVATTQAYAFEPRVSVGALAGTTGFGADVSWRFRDNLAVTGRYTDGLSYDTDFNQDGVDYDTDFDLKASSIKLDYFPFAGRFFLSAGIMMPDMEANVTGTPQDGSVYELNSRSYSVSEIGTMVGSATFSDGVQPYVGVGWRSSQKAGLALFSELGLVATDVDVSLRTSSNLESVDPVLQQDIRAEEQKLKDDIDKLPVFPVAVLGVTYTF